MSKITDYLLKDDVIVVMDVDGVLGYELLLPTELIEKIPIDGLCGKTDEDNLGFPYTVLDRYLRTGEIDDLDVKAKIDLMHKRCLFKSEKIPVFNPGLKVEVA